MNLRTTFLFAAIYLASCAAPTQQRLSSREYFSRYQNLADALRYYPQLLISGSGNQTKVVVRKNMSVQNQEPLYVIDGFPMGNSYARANQLLNMADVVNIRLLTQSYELATYGANGASGVIDIRTIKIDSDTD